jgi:nitrite reductase/ring-hydroxylating ferredoxin subunit
MATYEVGRADEFPSGSHKVVHAGKLEIGVFNLDGVFYAMTNYCPHQGGPLCAGPTSGEWACEAASGWHYDFRRPGEIVVCPWHGIEFDIKSGRCLSSPKMRVRTFPVTVMDGIVTISTDRS